MKLRTGMGLLLTVLMLVQANAHAVNVEAVRPNTVAEEFAQDDAFSADLDTAIDPEIAELSKNLPQGDEDDASIAVNFPNLSKNEKFPPWPLPDNTHLIDRKDNGFEIYRTSRPYKVENFQKLCASGVTEIMVLDGSGSIDAALAAKYCPQLKVVYNRTETAKIPMSPEFLANFDQWVQQAQAQGKKIAFRCKCGCHRTGRLAAYYQMKYQGLTPADAITLMYKYGKVMFLYGFLKPQVRALHDYIYQRSCSQLAQYCVK